MAQANQLEAKLQSESFTLKSKPKHLNSSITHYKKLTAEFAIQGIDKLLTHYAALYNSHDHFVSRTQQISIIRNYRSFYQKNELTLKKNDGLIYKVWASCEFTCLRR